MEWLCALMDLIINMIEDELHIMVGENSPLGAWGPYLRFSMQLIVFYFLLPFKDRRIIGGMGPLLDWGERLYLNIDLKRKMFSYDLRDLRGPEGFPFISSLGVVFCFSSESLMSRDICQLRKHQQCTTWVCDIEAISPSILDLATCKWVHVRQKTECPLNTEKENIMIPITCRIS